jgi:hypothetical protein
VEHEIISCGGDFRKRGTEFARRIERNGKHHRLNGEIALDRGWEGP